MLFSNSKYTKSDLVILLPTFKFLNQLTRHDVSLITDAAVSSVAVIGHALSILPAGVEIASWNALRPDAPVLANALGEVP